MDRLDAEGVRVSAIQVRCSVSRRDDEVNATVEVVVNVADKTEQEEPFREPA